MENKNVIAAATALSSAILTNFKHWSEYLRVYVVYICGFEYDHTTLYGRCEEERF